MKHERSFPGEPHTHIDLRDEPELVDCNGCGKDFTPDSDNQFKYANGAIVFYCDKCMRLGAHEKMREWEPYD